MSKNMPTMPSKSQRLSCKRKTEFNSIVESAKTCSYFDTIKVTNFILTRRMSLFKQR